MSLAAERFEPCGYFVVLWGVRSFRGNETLWIACEEEASQRRVVARPGGRPPHRRLMHRAGERDVKKTEVFAALLAVAKPTVTRNIGTVAADIDRPGVIVLIIVVGGRLALIDVPGLPRKGVVHDRELEALAAMDG